MNLELKKRMISSFVIVFIFFSTLEAKNLDKFNKGENLSDYFSALISSKNQNNDDALKLTSKSQAELLRRLHVIDDGKVIGGAKAFIIIWSKIPKYNFLAKIFSIKLLYFLFHYGYEIVAYFLFLKNKNQLK